MSPPRKTSSSSSSSTNPSTASNNPIGLRPANITWPELSMPTTDHPSTVEEASSPTTSTDYPDLPDLLQLALNHPSSTMEPFSTPQHIHTTPSPLISGQVSLSSSPSLAPSNDFLLTHGHLPLLNRAPPSTPPEGTVHKSSYSMPTVPTLFHPASNAADVASYRLERRRDPAAFDATTHSIKDASVDAKIRRGGLHYLMKEEYTVELASREDAARLEMIANREDTAWRSRTSPGADLEGEMLPDAEDEGDVKEENAAGTGIEKLLVGLLGEEGLAVVKRRAGIIEFGGMEEVAEALKAVREQGKFKVVVE